MKPPLVELSHLEAKEVALWFKFFIQGQGRRSSTQLIF